MNDRRLFCQRCLRALMFLTVLAFLTGQMPVTARPTTAAASRLTAPDINVQAEARVLTRFAEILHEYSALLNKVRSTPRPTSTDVTRLHDVARTLKGETPNAAQNYRELVRKARETEQFKDERKLDRLVSERIDTSNIDPRTKAKVREFLREKGGVRAALEAGPAILTQISASIDADLQSVVTGGTPLRVALTVPAAPTLVQTIGTTQHLRAGDDKQKEKQAKESEDSKCHFGLAMVAIGYAVIVLTSLETFGLGAGVGAGIVTAGATEVSNHCR